MRARPRLFRAPTSMVAVHAHILRVVPARPMWATEIMMLELVERYSAVAVRGKPIDSIHVGGVTNVR